MACVRAVATGWGSETQTRGRQAWHQARRGLLAVRVSEKGWAGLGNCRWPLQIAAVQCSTSPAAPAVPFDRIGERSCQDYPPLRCRSSLISAPGQAARSQGQPPPPLRTLAVDLDRDCYVVCFPGRLKKNTVRRATHRQGSSRAQSERKAAAAVSAPCWRWLRSVVAGRPRRDT